MAVVVSREQGTLESDVPPRIRWRDALLLFTVSAVLHFGYFYLDDVTRERSGTFAVRLIEEATGAYGAMLLFPAIAWAERRFPLTRQRWRRNWLAHFGLVVGYSAAHTTVLALGRRAIFATLGMGVYDYGLMRWRYPMELPSDVLGYLTLIGILTFMRVQVSARETDRRVAAMARDAVQARVESLTLRLQPHFLFNALNTISATLYTDPVAADLMISHLGDLLRHALRAGEHQQIAIGEELEVLRAYLAIIEARFGDRLHCELEVDDDVHGLAIPTLLLQPLVENAVRHGSVSESECTRVLVRIGRAGNVVDVLVENDVGDGMDEVKQWGTGLRSTRDRLQLLYGDAQRFSAVREGDRFRVQIRYPAREQAAVMAEETTHAAASAHR
jgi:hypothetical protein